MPDMNIISQCGLACPPQSHILRNFNGLWMTDLASKGHWGTWKDHGVYTLIYTKGLRGFVSRPAPLRGCASSHSGDGWCDFRVPTKDEARKMLAQIEARIAEGRVGIETRVADPLCGPLMDQWIATL
jgi:hypothetical protein